MKLLSTLVHNERSNLPGWRYLDTVLERIGWNGYIPTNFILDLLSVSKIKMLDGISESKDEGYYSDLWNLLEDSNITMWVEDTLKVIQKIGTVCDLRKIEKFSLDKANFNVNNISFSYNYVFDLKLVNDSIKELLDINDEHESFNEKLSDEVIRILTLTSGYGKAFKTALSPTTVARQMSSYGSINRISKHELASPLFSYKYAVKAYDISEDSEITHNSDKLVLGYYLGPNRQGLDSKLIIKILGAILLSHKIPKVTIYSFFGDEYVKTEMDSFDEVVSYFSRSHQLKLFPIDNKKALQTLITENKGAEIIYLPNVSRDCSILPSYTGLCKINIISYKGIKYNIKYASICKKTGGAFVAI